jgi:hypothetical protein
LMDVMRVERGKRTFFLKSFKQAPPSTNKWPRRTSQSQLDIVDLL